MYGPFLDMCTYSQQSRSIDALIRQSNVLFLHIHCYGIHTCTVVS